MSKTKKMKENRFTYNPYFLENKKFIQWRLTRVPELEHYWNSFIRENPDLVEEFQKAIEIFDKIAINKRTFKDTDILYGRVVESALRKKQREKRIIYSVSSVAAVALVLFITTFYFVWRDDNSEPATTSTEIVGKTLPEQEVMLLAGGKEIVLSQNVTVQLNNGQISYTDSTNTEKTLEASSIQTSKLIVPDGKRSFLVLADGSKVWINSGTELEFPTKFSGKTREIKVNGEIYMDVVRLDKQPFIVRTPDLDVQVFGTRFNVSAYTSDKTSSVVLVNGRVEVKTRDNQSIRMNPNEMVEFRDGVMNKENVDVSLYTSWVEGVFIFNRTPVSELFKKVGRYYNVTFENVESDKRITGKLYLSENLQDVLASISLLTGKEYTIENNIISIIK
ncbi:FecR protein [anaerobic digester metagenome]